MSENEKTEEDAAEFIKKALSAFEGNTLKDMVKEHGPCAHCESGKIVEHFTVQDLTPPDLQTCGGQSQMGHVSGGLHCSQCGIMYKFPPKKT